VDDNIPATKRFRADAWRLPRAANVSGMKLWMLLLIEIFMPGGTLVVLALVAWKRKKLFSGLMSS